MTYLLYDTALNGHYTLLLLQGRFPVHCSLFAGTKDDALIDVAPYLFQVDDSFYELAKQPLVALEAIILIETNKDIKSLATYFREFIYTVVEGQEYYFRFWDGRVLKNYLPKCNNEQLYYFFGPIDSFKTQGADTGKALTFDIHKEKLRARETEPIFAIENIAVKTEETVAVSDEQKSRRRFFY